MIEDSERGLRAAKAAGLCCWVIPSGLTAAGRFDAADAVLDNLAAAARAARAPLPRWAGGSARRRIDHGVTPFAFSHATSRLHPSAASAGR